MRPVNQCLLPFLLLLLLTATESAHGAEWGPWEGPSDKPRNAAGSDAPDALNPLVAGVRFFQRFISPVDGPRCRMYPTCSGYALQALDRHGPFLGTLLTVDRLLHEGSPEEHRHPVTVGGRLRYYDPLADNDFWLHPPET